jgi:hypothetical protein
MVAVTGFAALTAYETVTAATGDVKPVDSQLDDVTPDEVVLDEVVLDQVAVDDQLPPPRHERPPGGPNGARPSNPGQAGQSTSASS